MALRPRVFVWEGKISEVSTKKQDRLLREGEGLPGVTMARRPWAIDEYEALFRNNPPTEPAAPTGQVLTSTAQLLGRSPGAVAAQWVDVRSAVINSRTAASSQLIGYLRRPGWI